MKFLERLALILFSIIMIILSIISCLVVFDVIQLKTIFKVIEEVISDDLAKKIIIGTSIVSVLLAIKSLFFPTKTKKKQEIKTGILLENKDGRLLISKDTIENLVNNIVKRFEDVIESQTKIVLDANNNITVFISLLVNDESIIKEMSSTMQTKIKETIKRNTDLEVNQVNINIKDVESKSKNKNNQTKIKINSVKVNNEKVEPNIVEDSREENLDSNETEEVNNELNNSNI